MFDHVANFIQKIRARLPPGPLVTPAPASTRGAGVAAMEIEVDDDCRLPDGPICKEDYTRLCESICKEYRELNPSGKADDGFSARTWIFVILRHMGGRELLGQPDSNWIGKVLSKFRDTRFRAFAKLTDSGLPFSKEKAKRFDDLFPSGTLRGNDVFFELQRRRCCRFEEQTQYIDIEEHMLPPFYDAVELGKGTFAVVNQVECIFDGEDRVYARKKANHPLNEKAIQEELEVLQMIKNKGGHHHVVQYVGHYTRKGELNILLKPAASPGNLAEYLREDDAQMSALTMSFGCLATGLGFLNSTLRCKDIKPANILVDQDKVYFTDFGGAHLFSNTSSAATASTNTGQINGWYAAPEVLEHKQTRNARTDLFSLGCIFAEILTKLLGERVIELQTKMKTPEGVVEYGRGVDKLHTWLDALAGSLGREGPDSDRRHLLLAVGWCKAMTNRQLDLRPMIWQQVEKMKADCREEGEDVLEHFFCSECLREFEGTRLHALIRTRQGKSADEANKFLEEAEMLLTEQPAIINKKDTYDLTPLSMAAFFGDEEMVKLLLGRGASIIEKDNIEGGTPLHWAILGRNENVLGLLLKQEKIRVNAVDRFLGTPLAWAAQTGNIALVEFLLRSKPAPSVDAPSPMTLRTPLHQAAQNGYIHIAEALLRNGAKVDQQDLKKSTPLKLAQEAGKGDMVKFLIDNRAAKATALPSRSRSRGVGDTPPPSPRPPIRRISFAVAEEQGRGSDAEE